MATPHPRPLGAFDAVLERLRDDSFRCFGAGEISLRPGRLFVRPFSRVLEVHVGPSGQPLTAFVKILKPRSDTREEIEATRRNVAREYDTLASVHRALGSTSGFSTPRPIACYPELLALVTQSVDGEPLTRVLAKLRGAPSAAAIDGAAQVMRNVGAWLKAFQCMAAPDPPVSLDRLRAYLDIRLRRLGELRVCNATMRDDLLRYFDRRAQEVPANDLDSVPVHADFTPENVIVAGNQVSVLDFTMAKHGARYLDLAHMYMQIEMLKARPWFRAAAIDRQTAALLSGYDHTLQLDSALFELLLLQNVVCFVMHTAEMDISGLPARLLAHHLRRRHVKWLALRARAR